MKKKKISKKKKCAPSVKFKEGSCISLDILIDMVDSYNIHYPTKQIKLPSDVNPRKLKKYLLNEFNDKLRDVCDSQDCWIKQRFIASMKKKSRDLLMYNTFRPKGPKGTEWLSTTNINSVMKQYEKLYPTFIYLGTVPIDFDEIDVGIKNIDFEDLLKKNKYKLGIIFNLDEHYMDGSHWVGLYSDIKNGKIYFFDSYGECPEKRIQKFMKRIVKFCKKRIKTKNIDIKYNKKRHQFKNSECGVYSMNFILRLLKNKSFHDITNNITTDSEINKCRTVYFN